MADIEHEDNVLIVRKDLDSPLDMEFDIACRKLLDTEAKDLVIDMTRVKRIISQYLGALAVVAAESRESDRTLTIRARKVVAQVIRQVGFDQLMNLEEVD